VQPHAAQPSHGDADDRVTAMACHVNREPLRPARLAVDQDGDDLADPVTGGVEEMVAACREAAIEQLELIGTKLREDPRVPVTLIDTSRFLGGRPRGSERGDGTHRAQKYLTSAR
jgi:hypothetical protein